MDFYEHIEAYIDGRLSPNIKAEFEKAMDEDVALAKAVEHHDDARSLSEGLLELDMIETLERLHMEENAEAENNSKGSKGGRWILIVSLVILAILGWWFSTKSAEKHTHHQLLASYVRPVNEDATKSIDTVGMTVFEKGKYFFALNRFADSEAWLLKYLEIEKDENLRSKGYFWLGASYIEQNQRAEAQEAFLKSNEPGAKKNLELLNK